MFASPAWVTTTLVASVHQFALAVISARLVRTRVHGLVAVGASPTRAALALVAVHFVVTRAVYARVTGTLVDLGLAFLSSVPREAATFVPFKSSELVGHEIPVMRIVVFK
jgi:uncharacterized membrane protein